MGNKYATTNKDPSSASFLKRLTKILDQSVKELSKGNKKQSKAICNTSSFPKEVSQRLAQLILNSMQTPGRCYHSMQHVFDIIQEGKMQNDAILLLSALFHDVIYYSIDKKFSSEQANYLRGLLKEKQEESKQVSFVEPLTLHTDFNDPMVDMVVRLFAFTPGQELPKVGGGVNEFLSAIIAVKALAPWLEKPQLLQIATCIEATIPFRPIVDDKTPMDRLYDRLKTICQEEKQKQKQDQEQQDALVYSETWLIQAVQKAAHMANGDLCSFDSDDRDFFLDSSWKLIPEFRDSFLKEDCSLAEYHQEFKALIGRTGFLQGAVPKIFQYHGGKPADDEIDKKQQKTRENLTMVLYYGRVRLLQMTTLVAFCTAAGLDPTQLPGRPFLKLQPVTPPSFSSNSATKSDLTHSELTPEQCAEIRHWIVTGRRTAFDWDPTASPLAAFLWNHLGGLVGMEATLNVHADEPEEDKKDEALLRHLSAAALLQPIATGLAATFPEHADRFRQVAADHGMENGNGVKEDEGFLPQNNAAKETNPICT